MKMTPLASLKHHTYVPIQLHLHLASPAQLDAYLNCRDGGSWLLGGGVQGERECREGCVCTDARMMASGKERGFSSRCCFVVARCGFEVGRGWFLVLVLI
jgi:hypothetical protein